MRRRGFASGGRRSSKTVDRTASQSERYLLGLKAEAPRALGGFRDDGYVPRNCAFLLTGTPPKRIGKLPQDGSPMAWKLPKAGDESPTRGSYVCLGQRLKLGSEHNLSNQFG